MAWRVRVLSCLVAVALVGSSLVAAAGAWADTTSVSSFSKSGTDPSTGSSAVSRGAAGSTKAGDTINWVLQYQNNTGSNANVAIAENITGNQALVGGSVKGPPTLQPRCSFPLALNCSTSPATGGRFTALGSVPVGTTASSSALATVPVSFTTPGGDGYSVEGVGSQIYTVFHHTTLSTTVFCATLTNQVCPGWPAHSTFVDPTSGTAIGQGTSGQYATADSNGSFIVGGKLYWPVEATAAVGGTYPLGLQCLDLGTQKSCGFIQLDTATQAPAPAGAGRPVGRIASDGIAAANGDYYLFDGKGVLLCFDPSSGSACGTFNVTGGAAVRDPGAGALTNLLTLGSRVYLTFTNAGNNHVELTCFDTSTSALCGGAPSPFPIDDGAAANLSYADFVAPVLSANGAPLGACDVNKHACFDPTGAALADPYPGFTGFGYPGANVGFGSGAIVGSRYYAGDLATGKIDCFDFSARVGNGAVPACSGYTPPADASNYTVRALANLPGCLAADGDAAQIVVFNGQTGGQCATATAQTSATPSAYYCDGQTNHVQHWRAFTLSGLTGSEYQSATLTLSGPNGPVPGYTNLQLGPNQTTVDLSSLPVSGDTASLTAAITLTGVTNSAAVNASSVVLSWSGDPIEICFQTKVGASTCEPTPVISNTATATTTMVGGSGTGDGTSGGNSSGAVTFNEAPDTSQCSPSLSITKTADASDGDQTPVRKGEQIGYSYLVKNTGNVSIPTISINDPLVQGITCPKPTAPGLAPGDSETCTAAPYVVTQADVDGGGVTNTASASCTDRYGDPCAPSNKSSTHVPSSPKPSVAIDKHATVTPAADQTAAKVGDSIQYTYRVTNTGNVDEPIVSVDDPSAGKVVCPVPAAPGLAPGDSETCTAVATHTVTQADVDAGGIHDTAAATCTDNLGNSCPTSDPSKVTVPTVAPNPQTSIQKIANASGGDQAPITPGETIHYSYLVRNTGNVTLTSVSVDDPTGGKVTCPKPPTPGLAPGQSVLCTADSPYTVTQADVNVGSVTDTATSSCTAIEGGQCGISPPSTVTVPSDPHPAVAIDKRASVAPADDTGIVKVGDTISYTYTLTNVGNVDLATVSVSDPSLGAVNCPTPTSPGLAPGASITCTGASVHTVTQKDVDAGSVTDTATASCTNTNAKPCGPSNKAIVTELTAPAAPLTRITKAARVTPAADQHHAKLGDKIRYTFEVTNVGNVDLKTVAVSDPSLGPVSCPVPPAPGLAPSASELCTGDRTHTVNARDIKRKQVANIATARGTDPRGQVSAVSDPAAAKITTITPRLKLTKIASLRTAKAGQKVSYRIQVKDPSAVSVSNVNVCDGLPRGLRYQRSTPRAVRHGLSYCWTIKRLKAHQSHTLRITVKVASGARAKITNHATATAPGTNTARASTTIHVKALTRLKLTKTASRHTARTGQSVTYTLKIRDLSNSAATNVSVCDRLPHGLLYLRSNPHPHLRTGRYCWTIRHLAAHKSRTLQITINIAPGIGGKLTNHATATATGAHPTHASATIRVKQLQAIGCPSARPGTSADHPGANKPTAHEAC